MNLTGKSPCKTKSFSLLCSFQLSRLNLTKFTNIFYVLLSPLHPGEEYHFYSYVIILLQL